MKSIAEIAREAGLNPFEEQARDEKCRKFVRFIMQESAKILRNGDDNLWNETARRAGLNAPSETSRKRIIELLEGMQNE